MHYHPILLMISFPPKHSDEGIILEWTSPLKHESYIINKVMVRVEDSATCVKPISCLYIWNDFKSGTRHR